MDSGCLRERDGKYGVIDKSFEYIIDPVYEDIERPIYREGDEYKCGEFFG